MSTASENILNSLASLEQNLKEINSAKEQVNNVVLTSESLARSLELYQTSFEGLALNIKNVLEDSREFNQNSISKLAEQTNKISLEISKLTGFNVHKTFQSLEEQALKEFQQNLSKPIQAFDKQIKSLGGEVLKLTEFDFSVYFKKIENEVVEKFEVDLKKRMVVLDNKAQDFQLKINELKSEIIRLENFDIVVYFKDLTNNLTIEADRRQLELNNKLNEISKQGEILKSRLDIQDAKAKKVENLLVVIIGLIIVTMIFSIVI
jgi:hypothetical protein